MSRRCRARRDGSPAPGTAGLVGATLAVPGLVRGDNRTVAWAPNVGHRGDSLAARLERALGGGRSGPGQQRRRLRGVRRDAPRRGHGQPAVLYLTGTVGIGAGIVEDGDLVRGAAGFAGEVGHMPVGDPEAPCGCGRRGCWEASIGLHAMLEAVGMTELDTPLATARAVAARARTDAAVRAASPARPRRRPGTGSAGDRARPGGRRPGRLLRAARRPGPRPGPTHPRRAAGLGPPRRPELRPGALGIEAAALGAAEWSFGDVFAGELDLALSEIHRLAGEAPHSAESRVQRRSPASR